MHSGKGEWRGIPRETRERIIIDVLNLVSSDSNIRLFASVISKAATSNIDIAGDLFTQVASRKVFLPVHLFIYRTCDSQDINKGENNYEYSKKRQ
ncbi:MAG: hypothetical protein LBK66_11860 [Spirochaetaceae bacterium]|jgi:hypothetical protein|nr:hypothetical protein [Spirochaetaceae bacterium]